MYFVRFYHDMREAADLDYFKALISTEANLLLPEYMFTAF